jgi:foldase protein PrsA
MSNVRSICLLLGVLALGWLGASCGNGARSVPASAIAVVGDRTISRSQLSALMLQAQQSYAVRGRPFPAAGTPGYEHLQQLAVALLVEQAELEQEAPRLGVEIDSGKVEARLGRLKEDSFGGSEERYRARLRTAQMTDAQVRSAVRAQLLVEAVREAVTAEIAVGTDAVKQYYERHLAEYSTAPRRAVRHILVRTRVVADRVAARLGAGGSFAALARAYSIDPRTRARGGLLVLVRGRTLPSLDRVAFSLGVSRISRPFQTRFGWELVLAVSPIRHGPTTPFARVRDGIRRRLLGLRRDQAFNRWLDGVRAKYARRTAFAEGFAPPEPS